MADERRTIKNWGARLGAPDEMLTFDEAQMLASLVTCDRLAEILTALQDIQARLTRMELFIARTFPAYDQENTRMLKALSNGQERHDDL